jgi:1-deoxy-D-xylulose-5-phosphate synthase
VQPVPPALADLARSAALVVSVEDGVVAGGVGARVSQAIRAAGVDTPTREIGIPVVFPAHGKVPEVKVAVGLTVQDIGRRIVEWSALVQRSGDSSSDDASDRRADEIAGD